MKTLSAYPAVIRYPAAETSLTAARILLIGTVPCFPKDFTVRLAGRLFTAWDDVDFLAAFILAILGCATFPGL